MLRSHLPPHVRIRAHFGRTLTHRKSSPSLLFPAYTKANLTFTINFFQLLSGKQTLDNQEMS